MLKRIMKKVKAYNRLLRIREAAEMNRPAKISEEWLRARLAERDASPISRT